MATVTESAPTFATLSRVQIKFFLVGGTDPIADRLRAEVTLPIQRDDGRRAEDESFQYAVDDAVIGTFSAGDSAALRTLLGKIYNQAKTDRGV